MFTVFSDSETPVDYPTLEAAQAAYERLRRLHPTEEVHIFHAMTISEVLERYPISPWATGNREQQRTARREEAMS